MKTNRIFKTLILSLTVVSMQSIGFAAQKISIVVNPSSPLTAISVSDVQKIFSGKTKSINGVKVVPFVINTESETGKTFTSKVMKMSDRAWVDYWVAEKLKGGAAEPKQVADAEELKKYLDIIKGGAIGFTDETVNPLVFKTILEIPIN